MFICTRCKRPVGPYISPNLVVTSTRDVIYPARVYRRKRKKVVDPGGSGSQIATQEARCDECK